MTSILLLHQIRITHPIHCMLDKPYLLFRCKQDICLRSYVSFLSLYCFIIYDTIEFHCSGNNLAPDRLDLDSMAPVKLVFVKSQFFKFAPIKNVKDRSVFSKNVSLKSALLKFEPQKLAFVIFACRRQAFSKYAPLISAPAKNAFCKHIFFKLAPFKFIMGDISTSLASCKNCNASALRLESKSRKADRA
jgi:hypothetical protein